jgi:hypothetical protein
VVERQLVIHATAVAKCFCTNRRRRAVRSDNRCLACTPGLSGCSSWAKQGGTVAVITDLRELRGVRLERLDLPFSALSGGRQAGWVWQNGNAGCACGDRGALVRECRARHWTSSATGPGCRRRLRGGPSRAPAVALRSVRRPSHEETAAILPKQHQTLTLRRGPRRIVSRFGPSLSQKGPCRSLESSECCGAGRSISGPTQRNSCPQCAGRRR